MSEIFTTQPVNTEAMFVEPADIAARTGDDVTDAVWAAKALGAIESATALIRTITGRYLSVVTGDTISLDGTGSELVAVPEWPVTNVSRVEENGVLLTATDDYEWSALGLVRRVGAVWTSDWRGVTVTYDHGGGADLEAAKAVCLSIAARRLRSPDGRVVTAQTLGGAQVTYADIAGGGLTADEATVLGRLRSR